ncbi:MAG: GNAT family N-acetyltransferase [Solirubrobacteraceae bacterium]
MDLCALPNGRVVTIRAIRPDDAERLTLHHQRLSPESVYRRFMGSKPTLTASDLRYLVDIDGCDHYALVATVAEPDGEDIVAVARFVRLGQGSDSAEFAIVVGDAWQRQGLAGELLGRLADAAVTRGIDRFHAVVFADNVPILRLISALAVGPITRRRDGNAIDVSFEIPARREQAGEPAMIAAWAGS